MKHNTRYKEEVVVKTKSPLIRKKKANDLIHSENSLKRPSTRTSITAVDTPLKQRNISQKGNKEISELKEQIEKTEMDNCSFAPKITETTNQILNDSIT